MGTEAYLPRTPWKAPTFSCAEFEEASLKANPPRVIFDNSSDTNKTIIKIDSANRHGCLLDVVQLLTDLDLFISKAIISSDGGWFVDVFHVTDRLGHKVTDRKLITFVQQSLGATSERLVHEVKTCLGKPVVALGLDVYQTTTYPYNCTTSSPSGAAYCLSTFPGQLPPAGAFSQTAPPIVAVPPGLGSHSTPIGGLTSPGHNRGLEFRSESVPVAMSPKAKTPPHKLAVECLAVDRPGLLCDLTAAVLAAQCTVTDAEVWTHNGVAACILLVEEGSAAETLTPSRLPVPREGNGEPLHQGLAQISEDGVAAQASGACGDVSTPAEGRVLQRRATTDRETLPAFGHGLGPSGSALAGGLQGVNRAVSTGIAHETTFRSSFGIGELVSGGTGSALVNGAGPGGPTHGHGASGLSQKAGAGCKEHTALAMGAAPEREAAGRSGATRLPLEDLRRSLLERLEAVQCHGGGGTSSGGGNGAGGANSSCTCSEAAVGATIDGSERKAGDDETRFCAVCDASPAKNAEATFPTIRATNTSSSSSSPPTASSHDILRVTSPPKHTGRRLHQLLCSVGQCGGSRGWCDCSEGRKQSVWGSQAVSVMRESDSNRGDDGGCRKELAAVGEYSKMSGAGWNENAVIRGSGMLCEEGRVGFNPTTLTALNKKVEPGDDFKARSCTAAGFGSPHQQCWGGSGCCLQEAKQSAVSASVRNCQETHYTVVTVWCWDRPKLFFDTVCVITDLGFLIHHAVVQQEDEGMASQEYFIRSMRGTMLSSVQQRLLAEAIEAAVVQRCPQGTHLQLCASDRAGLLHDVTHTLSRHGITIRSASLFTRFGKAVSEITVSHPNGSPVAPALLEAVRREIGPSIVSVAKESPLQPVKMVGAGQDRVGEGTYHGGSRLGKPEEEFSLSKMLRVSSERLLSSLGLTHDAVGGSSGASGRKVKAYGGRRW